MEPQESTDNLFQAVTIEGETNTQFFARLKFQAYLYCQFTITSTEDESTDKMRGPPVAKPRSGSKLAHQSTQFSSSESLWHRLDKPSAIRKFRKIIAIICETINTLQHSDHCCPRGGWEDLHGNKMLFPKRLWNTESLRLGTRFSWPIYWTPRHDWWESNVSPMQNGPLQPNNSYCRHPHKEFPCRESRYMDVISPLTFSCPTFCSCLTFSCLLRLGRSGKTEHYLPNFWNWSFSIIA